MTETVGHIRAYITGEPGAFSRLMDSAKNNPEAMTRSLVALGAVLLDISAGAFKLPPDEMFDKVWEGIVAHSDGPGITASPGS